MIETMTHDGKDPLNDAHGGAPTEAHTALYALLAGAQGCGRQQGRRGWPKTTSSPASYYGSRTYARGSKIGRSV